MFTTPKFVTVIFTNYSRILNCSFRSIVFELSKTEYLSSGASLGLTMHRLRLQPTVFGLNFTLEFGVILNAHTTVCMTLDKKAIKLLDFCKGGVEPRIYNQTAIGGGSSLPSLLFFHHKFRPDCSRLLACE